MVPFYCKNVIFGGISMKKRTFAILLSFCLLIGLLPAAALAAENTMTFGAFLEAVADDNGTFDGKGVTVQWKPNESLDPIQRIQNSNAQYQIFGKLEDLAISNVHFEYVPADIPGHSDGWSGINQDYTKEQVRNAEFQLLNSGNVTITNCTFEKIIPLASRQIGRRTPTVPSPSQIVLFPMSIMPMLSRTFTRLRRSSPIAALKIAAARSTLRAGLPARKSPF